MAKEKNKVQAGLAVPSGYAVTVARHGDAVLMSCPDVPEVHAVAYADDQVAQEALDAIETALYGYVRDRRSIPTARTSACGRLMVYLPTLSKAKLALYNAVLAQGLSKAELARLWRVQDGGRAGFARDRPANRHGRRFFGVRVQIHRALGTPFGELLGSEPNGT